MNEKRCKKKYTTYRNDKWGAFHSHTCAKKAWKDGFCKQHHPDTVKERKAALDIRRQEKQKAQPWYKLMVAQERIQVLETEIANLKNAAEHAKTTQKD